MKLTAMLAAAICAAAIAPAQTTPVPAAPAAATPVPAAVRTPQPPAPVDAATADAVIHAVYASVSHAPDADPDWSHMRTVFLPSGRLTPPQRPTGEFVFLSAEDFISRFSQGIASRRKEGKEQGFVEREISRKMDCFGNVCQVFSTYESRYTAADPKPFARGINAMQLVKDGNRWWIANLVWDQESPEKPIPAAYLP